MKSTKSRAPMTPMKPMLPPKTPKSRHNSNNSLVKDPVQVFCRIRPLQSEADLSCVRTVSPSIVALIPPESAINYKISNLKETQYVFKHLFDMKSNQHEVYTTVAQPLVENLVKGKNGLLLSYGVTGSGKTFTMTGNINNRGIMPRCLDVLFKTISDYQAKKFVFKPDKLNGFEILSEADAMLERQNDMHSRLNRGDRKDIDPEIASRASSDVTVLNGMDEDNMYAVFITYVEIYNNSVFDLLEHTTHQKAPQSKIIREDANKNMYVHGVTEMEIKSVEDALDAFHAGQKRKRMGHTLLNAESSRSHSVFSIRLVQAPVDSQGEYVMQDKNIITISQLSLVDLAGSERTNRTKNTGQRLREAGNINNSLMTLRTCMEILRENQMTGSSKKVPYRDSKVTHLFKNYFDGEGQVKMIVCINPRAEDYDETAQVMKFAEMTQEVQIARPTPMRTHLDFGLTPGRRKANQIFKQAVDNLEDLGRPEARNLEIDLGLVYSLRSFPRINLTIESIDETVRELMNCLEDRLKTRGRLLNDFDARQISLRQLIYDIETENVRLKTENSSITATLYQERDRMKAYESKIIRYESSIDDLNRKLRDKNERLANIERQLSEKQVQLTKKEMEKEKQQRKFTSKIAVESDKMSRELDMKLKEQKRKMEQRMKDNDEKLRLVSTIINSEENVGISGRYNNENYERNEQPASAHVSRPARGVPQANLRHRRSKSVGTEGWLEHKTTNNPTPLGTILQPYYRTTKTVTKLTDVKDVANSRTSKYCLITQKEDTDGEVETKLYKGDVINTKCGGAQVVFDDVECLKQLSPTASPPRRKRNSQCDTPVKPTDVKSRCSIGIEGHSTKKQRI